MFENILGNNRIKDTLKIAIESDKISHSYLFSGIEGIGKKLFAQEFAKQVLCLNDKKQLNCVCESCIKYNTKNHPDFNIIEPNNATIKIEEIRGLQKKIQERPIISKKKVYIIDNFENMTKEAQNCLLKTLEEPPEYVMMILITRNESNILTTIKSRCMILKFNKLANEEMLEYLNINSEQDVNEELLEISEGSIQKLILLKEKKDKYQSIKNIIEELDKKHILEIYDLADTIYEMKEEIIELLEYMNVIILKKVRNNINYANCIEIIEETKKRIKQNANYDMCIDNMLLNMWEEIN